jgi:hypothetical protein
MLLYGVRGITKGHGLDADVSKFWVIGVDKNFLLSTSFRPDLGPPNSYLIWANRPVHEADDTFPTSFKVRNTWNYTSTSPRTFMA